MLVTTSLYCQTSNHYSEKYESLIPEVNAIISKTNVVGVSIAIIENYRVVWAKGFGIKEARTNDSVTTTTLFQAASITKSLTANTVMKEVQAGKIALHEDVNKQLVSWHIPTNNYTKTSPVTVKQLLSHTAGITPNIFPPYTLQEELPSIVQALSGEKPAHNQPVTVADYPGKRYAYTGGGYAILELLLMDITQKTYPEIIKEQIFQPLKMNHSTFGFRLPDEQFPSIASGHLKGNKVIDGKYFITYPLSFGGLWSTPTDLAMFLSEIQSSSKEKQGRLLSQENARLMLTPVSYSSHTAGGQYALGFTLEKRGPVLFFGHDGHNYGYISSMLGSVEGGYGMVIMTNSENGWKAINKIKKLVGRKYWGLGPYHPKKD